MVIQLGQGKTGLHRVSGQAVLLSGELGHSNILHHGLLLAAQGRQFGDHVVDEGPQGLDACIKAIQALCFVRQGVGQRGIAPLGFGQLVAQGLHGLLGRPQAGGGILSELPVQDP